MSLAVFEEAARAHFANPPVTWYVVAAQEIGWRLVDNHDVVVDRAPTRERAEQLRYSCPAAIRWHARTDWYLGYDTQGRRLTASEQLVISDIVERIAAAATVFKDPAATIRPAQFRERGADDDRIWPAVALPDGRYQLRGDYLHAYDPDDLDFLDETSASDFMALLCDLLNIDALPRSA
ncbi:hypothetical protein [Mycobacterium sp. TY815]|uniref:hypothetical protein n=1 Tax=Mycobacterium sp. TY815 TaxID=3050581 RepID=UPI002741820D|nr:hypothetical protein [Mycobacterium sp. TY815]MDP7707418.1 hypothetical protein [Mycobacterium sp. TY815]